jgi:hypothetical protein
MTTSAFAGRGAPPTVEYLGDTPDLIVHSQQAWGELGLNVCAHAPGQTPLPLQIKDRHYTKGLGHHAGGEIIVELDGQYDAFEAEIGVQWQQGNTGSVVFRVFVDGKKRFDSGVMRERDPARPVHVALKGAQEMRLVAGDAGDGITCDCADWAEARLIRSGAPGPRPQETLLDIAPFARVITSDPARMDGARANRIQEYHAEDLYLDTDVFPAADGPYAVPRASNGMGCLGLRWYERRSPRELGIEFAGPAPSPQGAQAQIWVGESPYQGAWKPLKGGIEAQGNRWVLRPDGKDNPDLRAGTRKIRWVFPASGQTVARCLTALVPARLETVTVRLELDNPLPGQTGRIEIYNGFIASPSTLNPQPSTQIWDLSAPLRLELRCLRPRYGQADRTLLRLQLPSGAFGIAVDDLRANEAVYVKEARLFAIREPSPLTPAAWRRKIARRKTVLERVRRMPDQTFAQALAKTHHAPQDTGPMLLSLACDNHKFIAQREGAIRFDARPEDAEKTVNEPLKNAGELIPRFGSGRNSSLSRHLDGGWLPAPVTEVREDGVAYRQRAFVAPYGRERLPLCVVEYTVENESERPAQASLALTFLADADKRRPAELSFTPYSAAATDGGRLLAALDMQEASSLRAEAHEGVVMLTGAFPPKTSARVRVLIPAWPVKTGEKEVPRGGPELWTAFEDYWHSVMAPAAEIVLPDPLLTNVIRASQVHCLLAARSEANGARIAPWIASMSYGPLESECNSIVRGMDLLGHQDFARRALDFYVARYSPEGFLTTGYTLMGTGWHLWTLGEHFELAHDTEWLKRVAPEVARVCAWIVRQREKAKRPDARGEKTPFYGLMPPGVIADWNAFAFYFCLNGYYCAGLRQTAGALAAIGYPGAEAFLQDAAEFREDILRAYRRTQALAPVFPLQNGTWIPEYPSQVDCPGPTGSYFPGEDGNRSWCYDVEVGAHQLAPQGILDPDGPEVARMMDHMEDVQFLSDGWFDYPGEQSRKDWFDLGGFSKVQPYYTRNAEIYALRDDVKPFVRSYFNTLAAMLNTEVLSLWEHFHAAGAWNKTHETGYFLQQTRFMLVLERGGDLWLAPLVTSHWLKDSMTVGVRNAPTRFGPVSYRITSHAQEGYIEASIEPPARTIPRALILRLRHPEGRRMRAVTVNGAPHRDFDPAKEIIRLAPGSGPLTVRAEF